MARIRTIKPEFFTSETVTSLPLLERLLFVGLWTHVDDEGRAVDNAGLIKAALFPLDADATTERIQEGLRRLHGALLIDRYTVNGRRYLVVRSWLEHQKISHPSDSKLPSADDPDAVREIRPDVPQEDSGKIPEDSLKPPGDLLPERKGMEGKGTGKGMESPDSEVVDLCSHLAERIATHGHVPKPKVTQAWHKDMRLLRDRGPLHVEDPEPLTAQKIRTTIDVIFTQLTKRSNKGFCWADQIQSPSALRDHWLRMAIEFNKDVGGDMAIVTHLEKYLAGERALS